MKKYIIECDRCGAVIEDDPFTVGLTTKDRESGDLSPDYDADLEGIDLCRKCADKIKRYIKGGMQINKDFEKVVQEMEKKSENEIMAKTENVGYTENTVLSEDGNFDFSPDEGHADPFEPDEVRAEKAEIDKLTAEVSTPKKKKQSIVKQDGPTKRELVWEMYKKKVKPKDIAQKLKIASGTVSQYIYLCKQQGWK